MIPLVLIYDGGGRYHALNAREARKADERHGVGEVVSVIDWQDRSDATHRHEFAFLREAWMNLPEALADEFPTAEHFRKRLLIDCGFYAETIIDVGTTAGALRVAAYAQAEDGFAKVVTRGGVVVVRKAKSQSRRTMDKGEFQASKSALIEAASALIGTTPEALHRAEAA